jgi:hypothetical protein
MVTAEGPVLTFIAAALPGQSRVVMDPRFGGEVSAMLEAEYHSASDKTCRRFVIRRSRGAEPPRSHYACVRNGVWQLVQL